MNQISPILIKTAQLSQNMQSTFIEQVCRWEQWAYGINCHRTAKQLTDCLAKNDKGMLWVMDEKSGSLMGAMDAWALHAWDYEQLKEGLVYEEQLNQSMIQEEQALINQVYIGSVISEPTLRKTPIGSQVFKALFNGFCNLVIDENWGPCKLLGVGSTAFGQQLLTDWGFVPVQTKGPDTRPRYEKTLSHSMQIKSLMIA